ncbi:MAG: hypothetical protein ACREOO_28880 [bacterium]
MSVLLPSGDEEVELEILLSGGSENEPILGANPMEATGEVVNLFALAVNEQMFSMGRSKPVPAFMKLLEAKWDHQTITRAFRYKIKSVPPTSFLVLVALLVQTHHAYEPLNFMSLRTVTQAQSPVDHLALLKMDRNVPKRIEELPFRVDDSGLERRKNITVIFEFKSRISVEIFAQLKEALNIWDHLVVLSGFHLDFKEVEELPNFGSTGHISPFVVTHSLDFFDGYVSAFNALINLSARLSAEGRALDSITIE